MKENKFKYTVSVLIVLSIILFTTILISSLIGAVDIKFQTFFEIFKGNAQLTKEGIILKEIRLPRIFLGVLTGGVLACCGVVFQALLRNKLADPYILGISGGAALGSIIALLIGVNIAWIGFGAVPIFAFSGALATIFLVYYFSQIKKNIIVDRLLLVGVVINYIFSAFILFLTTLLNFTDFHSVMFWLMGSLGVSEYPHLAIISIYCFLGISVLWYYSYDLNIISIGEEEAEHLGIEVERVKIICFVAASLLIGAVVSLSGLIGFIGLIIPHILRFILGADHRVLIPSSFLLGGIFLVVCDTIARSLVAPTELPVGVVTAIIGGPVFVYLLKKRG
ncbi:MAG: iron ABC transporter permease [Candidatus Firestonebacteria bacterium]|nr:iron ABC transporter permease [Candidatus Firestonebacteria bacterium]